MERERVSTGHWGSFILLRAHNLLLTLFELRNCLLGYRSPDTHEIRLEEAFSKKQSGTFLGHIQLLPIQGNRTWVRIRASFIGMGPVRLDKTPAFRLSHGCNAMLLLS